MIYFLNINYMRNTVTYHSLPLEYLHNNILLCAVCALTQ